MRATIINNKNGERIIRTKEEKIKSKPLLITETSLGRKGIKVKYFG